MAQSRQTSAFSRNLFLADPKLLTCLSAIGTFQHVIPLPALFLAGRLFSKAIRLTISLYDQGAPIIVSGWGCRLRYCEIPRHRPAGIPQGFPGDMPAQSYPG